MIVPEIRGGANFNGEILKRTLAIEKIGDWKKLGILVQNQSFWNIVMNDLLQAPRNSGRDNAAGILIGMMN